MKEIDPSPQLKFGEVFAAEKAEIRTRRLKHFCRDDIDGVNGPDNLVGLALSGGGIRSATFCLGFLQELDRLKHLRIFDYLSTVSGGGYVGGWWSAWLSREEVVIRAKEESPEFTAKDIKNVASLVARLRDSSDEVSRELLKQMHDNKTGLKTLKLVEQSNDGHKLPAELVEFLVAELNVFLWREPLPTAPSINWPTNPPKRKDSLPEPTKMVDDYRQREKKRWTNRVHLEHTFPYELRNIFPPEEEIEPNRKYLKANGTESEGSLCAWYDPIHHLRLFANYLTPRKGFLSADTWRAVSVVIRNLLLTWLILLPLLTAVMLLGQTYFLFVNRQNFSSEGVTLSPAILAPIGILIWFTIAMAVAWLLCNRDQTSRVDFLAQVVCFVALGALLVSSILMITSAQKVVKEILNLEHGQLPITIAIAFAVITVLTVVVMWHWRIKRNELTDQDWETVWRWKREVRRGRFSRAQARLLVWTTMVSAVILVSWFSCKLFSGIGLKSPSGNWKAWLPALSALVSAIGGSIFTALRAAPSTSVEKPTSHKPAVISQFIFASTPGLVVFVLAVLAAGFAHKLLFASLSKDSNVDILLRAAGFSIVALGLALALYEMKDVKWSGLLYPSLYSLAFIAAIMVNVSWLWQAWVAKVFELGYTPRWLASATLGSFLAVLILQRAIPKGKWRWRALYRNLNLFGIPLKQWRHDRRERSSHLLVFIAIEVTLIVLAALTGDRIIPAGKWRWRMVYRKLAQFGIPLKKWRRARRRSSFLLVFIAIEVTLIILATLTAVGWVIGHAIFLYTRTPQNDGRILGGLMLAIATLAGGAVLYRLLTIRSTNSAEAYLFESRLFASKRFSKRPEWLWTLAALSTILPLGFLCLTYELYIKYSLQLAEPPLYKEPWFFPLSLALLLASLIALRSLVLQRPKGAPALVGWTGTALDGILGKISKQNHRQAQAVRLLAVLTVGTTLFGDTLVKTRFVTSEIGFLRHMMISDVIFMGVAFVINLPIFGVSVFKLPAYRGLRPSPKFKATSLLYRKWVLWALAAWCVAVALVSGYSLRNWLEQLSMLPLNSGLTPVLLPVAVGCLLMIVFEMAWGTAENRRAIWLIGLAYTGIAAIFLISLVGDGAALVIAPAVETTTHNATAEAVLETLKSIRVILGLFAAVCVWVVSLGWMVDPNSVSMHQFYRGRLVRAYLGASNIRRRWQGDKEITESAAGDDLPLKSLSNCEKGGPYHLVNTTLNLVAGRDLATAQRSASSFLLSQKYCGSVRTNYRPTDKYMNGQLSLGTAIAASGAAVSPNMGSKKPTAALAMLMTLLNVRLGYWAPTPSQRGWNLPQPRLWPFYLIREFLSQTNDLSSYCYLTDGGHFDNTGLYPLIERGCRFVILLDCGADPQPPCFQDLGEVIRRCRIDFGTEIVLDLNPLITQSAKEPGRCFVVGKIHYASEHLRTLRPDYSEDSEQGKKAKEGTIVYFKPAVVDGVTADVRQYAIENSYFPQQTTANQWFDEAQFESYRRLGITCANQAFDINGSFDADENSRIPLRGNPPEDDLGTTPRLTMKGIENLFCHLKEIC